jgi:hypothetical protein
MVSIKKRSSLRRRTTQKKTGNIRKSKRSSKRKTSINKVAIESQNWWKKKTAEKKHSHTHKGHSNSKKSKKSKKTKILPIFDPLHNMREICKQCVLLEDHLFCKGKFCMDCCMKHSLMIEALAEEASSLDVEQKHTAMLYLLPSKIREAERDISVRPKMDDPIYRAKVAQKIRKIRKLLTPLCYGIFNNN